MRLQAPDTWRRSLARWLMAAATLMVASGWNAAASASGSISHSSGAGESHSCACARCSGEKCCCAPKGAKSKKSPAGPSKNAAAPVKGSGPCFSQTPCGDAGVPTPTPVGPLGKAALVASPLGGSLPVSGPGFVRMTDSARWSSPFLSRPDEPPETQTFA
ncbi:hypothetical protein EP7_000105 [Isosphaeraceae bacterium EP7]